jgi:maltose O-acetyltransferase
VIFFSKLPNSAFPMGKLYNSLRVFVIKRIVSIGNECTIQRNVYFGKGRNISIGNYCQINDNVRLDNVKIGNNVMIARDCILLGKMHEFDDTNIPMNIQGAKNVEQTIIEDDVWIGARAIINPGLKIRKGTIIGAGAVLTKNTDEYGIYGGIPAKKIKKRK